MRVRRPNTPSKGATKPPSPPSTRVAFGLATVLCSAIALFAVAPAPFAPLARPSASGPGPSRIVILFNVDTLRADRLGTYGYALPTSPNLDRILAGGLVADHAITSAGWTLPAHASLFSSQTVARHGVRTARQMIPAGVPLLAEVLSRNGVRCLAIASGGYVDASFGFSRGFERYLFSTDQTAGEVRGALRFVDQSGPGPLFLFLHTVQVHNYEASERGARGVFGSTDPLGPGWNEPVSNLLENRSLEEKQLVPWLSARYDASVRETDESLGELVKGLEARGLWERTALVFTSDHGEEIGERPPRIGDSAPARGHTVPYLYEEHIRIPLAVRAPWRKDMRGRIPQPVSSIDVAPTILDLFDVAAPKSMTGESLARPRTAGRVVVSEASPYGAVALLEGTHKVIVRPGFRARHWETGDWLDGLPAEECFDLARDPGERNGKACEGPWAQKLLDGAERYIASSFRGDLVIRAEPNGSPCRLDIGAATEAGIRFFGDPPNAGFSRKGGTDRLALGRVEGPVWIAIQPRDAERALSLQMAGCGNVITARGERLPVESEASWSDLLWRGTTGLPDEGTVLFSVSPGVRPLHESADYPSELTARLRSLGYVSPGRAAKEPERPDSDRPAPGTLPAPGQIRIRITS